jgi:hypothetical protein
MTSPSPQQSALRPPAEQVYARELAALRANNSGPRTPASSSRSACANVHSPSHCCHSFVASYGIPPWRAALQSAALRQSAG